MNKECIWRDDAENAIADIINNPIEDGFRDSIEILSRIHMLPVVDAVVHAQWIKCGDNQPMSCDNVYCCSNCKGNKRLEWHLKPFCEECGAKMDANKST